MRECARMIRAECYKMKGTWFFPFHVLIACFSALLFLAYYACHDFAPEKEWAWYIKAVSMVFPMMVSIVCMMSVRIEEKNHFLAFLGIGMRKRYSLLAKWAVLSAAGFFAVTTAVGAFFVIWSTKGKSGDFLNLCIFTILVLCFSSQGMYLMHLCVCLRWSGNISLCIGAFQSVLAALLQTGLGDGIWQFFTCAWSGRWSSCLLLYVCANGKADFSGNLKVCVCIMILWITGVFAWFQYFEGRHPDD